MITVTAAGDENYNEGQSSFIVNVLPLSVWVIVGDNKINIAEKASGFLISGVTGRVVGGTVKVTVGTQTLNAVSSTHHSDPHQVTWPSLWSTWRVNVPRDAFYLTDGTVAVKVEASKAGYMAANPVNLTLTVDLTAPAVRYTAPGSLQVGEAITEMSPKTSDLDIVSFVSTSLPAGLSVNRFTGIISGAPTTANTSTVKATVKVTDNAGNSTTVSINFPAVDEATVSPASLTFTPA